MSNTRRLIPLVLVLTAALPARAQERQTIEEVREIRQFAAGTADGDQTVRFAWSGEAFDGKQPIKNAPYSAAAVTEVEQTLGDGNRIHQKTRSQLARDREGRTRRELTLSAVGPLAMAAETPKMIFLHDPVAGTGFTLDPDHKVARKMPRPIELPAPLEGKLKRREGLEQAEDFFIAAPPPGPEGTPSPLPLVQRIGGIGLQVKKLPAPKSEDLGTQVMEGVKVLGTRTTVTIPAGEIGNERPIVTVSERWTSPELGVVVMSRHSDPRLGTTTYRLTELVRSDPQPALFQVPADYEVRDDPGRAVIIKRKVSRAAEPR